MPKSKDPNLEKSGVEPPIRSGAKQISKPTRKPMSDKTASEQGRWTPRSGSNMSPPTPGAYAPPPAEKSQNTVEAIPGNPISSRQPGPKGPFQSDSSSWPEWLKPESPTRRKPDLMR